jgi:Flp pilus assembly protein TadG
MTTTPEKEAIMKSGSLRKLHKNRKGAVLVEFLVAVMPLMITFSSFVQVAQVATARLVVKHSAVVGARAAAVISNKYNNTPDQKKGQNKADIDAAVDAALGPWRQTMDNVKVEINDDATADDPFGMIQVTVTAQYHCSVPFGSGIVCKGGSRPIVHKAAFPHQGACYTEGGGGGC